MKLNLGCGNFYFNDYINIDINKKIKADYYLDLEKDRLPFEDSSCDEVYIHHVLEHLGEGYFHCIKEIYRVCKHGARVIVVFPHHFHRFYFDDPTHKRPITWAGLAALSKTTCQYGKENGYSDTLVAFDLDVDFRMIDHIKKPDKRFLNPETNKLIYPDNIMQEIELSQINVIEEATVYLEVYKEET